MTTGSNKRLSETKDSQSSNGHLPVDMLNDVVELPREELFAQGVFPYTEKLKRKEYERLKAELQIELVKMQYWVRETGQRILILNEGRDAAGKGGTIKRFMEHLNPRGARIVALEKPTDIERSQWYFQRYIAHLPSEGEIVFFDRSWYNRAMVERVMGFCTPAEYLEFMRQTPELERMLTRSPRAAALAIRSQAWPGACARPPTTTTTMRCSRAGSWTCCARRDRASRWAA